MYIEGAIFQVNLNFGYYTYVVIVEHYAPGVLGFKSILYLDGFSVEIEMLRKYEHTFICSKDQEYYADLLADVNKYGKMQIHQFIWQLLDQRYSLGMQFDDLMLLQL